MPQPRPGWTDVRVEQAMGTLLRAGVILSAGVVLLGGVVYLARHGQEPVDYHAFLGEPEDLRNPVGIVRDALAFRGRGLVQLGLLLLIATPVARVVFSVVAFALQRDYTYVGVTLIVLAVLLYSLFSGGPDGGRAALRGPLSLIRETPGRTVIRGPPTPPARTRTLSS
jgi:uncharacterized membrane protein